MDLQRSPHEIQTRPTQLIDKKQRIPMFWPFIEIDGELTYCPLADFGTQQLREGRDIYGKAIIAQPLVAHLPLHNAAQANGKIVVVERGQCDFVTKVLHAQAAGAIAVLVANTSREHPHEAFVMDAGRRSEQEIGTIRIPAMMISYHKATILFEQLRECFLDRRELSMTMKFLGAQSSALVLEQIENATKQREQQEQERVMQYQREQQQREAAELLRRRLGKDTGAEKISSDEQLSPTPSPSTSPARSTTSSSQRTTPRARKISIESHSTRELMTANGDMLETISMTASAIDRFENQSSTSLSLTDSAMNPWCPMVTALLIVDVQNYFALEQNGSCVPRLHETNSRIEFYKRIKSILLPNLQDILLACRACEGVEIIYTIVESATHDGRERSRAHKHAGLHIPRGGFGAKVVARVAPSDDDIVIPRTGVNVFETTNIDFLLRNLGVSHVVITGLSILRAIPLCVQTALDRGYQVTLIQDAILSTDGPERLDDALRQCEKQGGQVIAASALVATMHGYSEENNAN